MSELEDSIRSVVREIVREELSQVVERKPVKLLTATQAGERMGVDRQSVYRLVREGQLKAIHTSEERFKIHPDEVERFIRDGGWKPCLKEVPAARLAGRR